jgi:hypothetical protein
MHDSVGIVGAPERKGFAQHVNEHLQCPALAAPIVENARKGALLLHRGRAAIRAHARLFGIGQLALGAMIEKAGGFGGAEGYLIDLGKGKLLRADADTISAGENVGRSNESPVDP